MQKKSEMVRKEQRIAMEKEFKDRITVLAIAYHNLGVE
jgi:hypothetical protein